MVGEKGARARVKWATAVLPIVRGGVKIMDPNWQASALLVKLLVRGMSVGYEPWKALVRYRVAQTRQSRKGRWPTNANWIMNNQHIAKLGSSMWQGVMKAWNTIQSGLEQQDPTSWSEIMRQPLFGNRLLTNELGIQWGTESRSNLRRLADKGFTSLKDIARFDGHGWRTFPELLRIRSSRVTTNLYTKMVISIPWGATPMPTHTPGQWVSLPEDGHIRTVHHLHNTDPLSASTYRKDDSERLVLLDTAQPVPPGSREVLVSNQNNWS